MKIAAVVVTYNRLSSLIKIIGAIRDQSRKADYIIVVNNGSIDGTEEWLREQTDLIIVHQNNQGSGGGQRTGILKGIELKVDFTWCMDDDGLPSYNCLEKLIESGKLTERNVLGSIVYDIDKRDLLAFETYYVDNNSTMHYLTTKSEVEALRLSTSSIPNIAAFFNSVIFPTSLLKEVGSPIAELFIWGDENEYFARILKKGFKIETIIDSVFFHPKDRMPLARGWWGTAFFGQDDWKSYCFFRNKCYIMKRYNHYGLLKFLVSNLLYRIFVKNSELSLGHFFKSSLHGLSNNLSQKIPF
ncbi:glycosyltransferase [Desertivirga brevis]|uniref:glycosyltransferase n=1 Tax=Desertivirga brevis TaxID=2810310 RepID=UPI001A967F62|nr:glycosyltransferase [Pedobacter sp. SYSU D00873]